MSAYTTSKSNLVTQELTPPRTGNFGARSTYRGESPGTRLQPIFHQVSTMIQDATDDDRNYTVKIKITADITVEPWQAEIGEYVPTGYFDPNLGMEDQTLQNPNDPTEKRVFRLTDQGYQRIE